MRHLYDKNTFKVNQTKPVFNMFCKINQTRNILHATNCDKFNPHIYGFAYMNKLRIRSISFFYINTTCKFFILHPQPINNDTQMRHRLSV